MTVSITGGCPSFRRSRRTVTATALVNGSACSSHTCSRSSSAVTPPPSAEPSTPSPPRSVRPGVGDIDCHALGAQTLGHGVRYRRVVLHDQHPHGLHGGSSAMTAG